MRGTAARISFPGLCGILITRKILIPRKSLGVIFHLKYTSEELQLPQPLESPELQANDGQARPSTLKGDCGVSALQEGSHKGRIFMFFLVKEVFGG